ncbi:MAG TPA: zinc ribbon domain-containing protein [Burkholderiales bacterium]|jgi:putative FmdB family regulatory protein|nr:zinc ribbon domain-containing protein [Burkholderiales bacterium]
MPIYEYRCSACGQEHEALQKVTEPPLTECPSCGRPGLQKLLTAAGFHLKGSGWYATDFKGGAKKPEEKKPADTKTDSKTAKTDSKTDTKASPKSEPKTEAAA